MNDYLFYGIGPEGVHETHGTDRNGGKHLFVDKYHKKGASGPIVGVSWILSAIFKNQMHPCA